MSFTSRFTLVLLTASLLACQAPSQPAPQPSALALSDKSTLSVGKAPHRISAAGGFINNFNSGENTISVIDTKTDKIVTTITVPSGHPGYSMASHDGKYVLVVNPDAGQLHVFAPGQKYQLVQSISVGTRPDRHPCAEASSDRHPCPGDDK